MKRALLLAIGTACCIPLAMAADGANSLKGCAAKVASIQNELAAARAQGPAHKIHGLEKALRAANQCDDEALRLERERDVQAAQRKVREREASLQEELREGDEEDIAKARQKLQEAQDRLAEAKAEQQR